ncbi:O-antigen ligase domain-containing protein, partial [Pseudomonas sp. 5S4]|nr:O-antigen ligase domain-containing protein [Pseudomonas sp. 5S4]
MTDANDRIKNGLAIALAACVAILILQGNGSLFYAGIVGICFLLLMAAVSPWLGLLALYPLAFMLPPAPTSMGLPELTFVALLAVIFIGTFVRVLRSSEIRSVGEFYFYPVLIGLVILCVNLAVAVNNNVPLVDWVRGVIPFLFLFTLLPISVLVGSNESRIRWLGGSVVTLGFLVAGFVVFYYFYHRIWQPYWLVSVNGESVRISQEAALDNLKAVGPMRDRITMLVAQAT